MVVVEELSLEETNKIRISLGLKPLTDDKAAPADKEKEAEQNYSRVREQAGKERADRALRDKIAKVRNKQELHARLKGATLGDLDDPGDTLSWIKKSKKREKELAKRRQQELEEMDKMFQEEYTEKDLHGLKVAHDLEEMADGDEQILTLRDNRILDNNEDELQNVLLAEHERTQKRIELKTKNKGYTGYDDEEFTNGQEGLKRSVLSKYDEDITGAQEQGFRLGASATTRKFVREQKEEAATSINKSLLSIDYAKNQEISDYLQERDIGFKKPKKKKKHAMRKVEESDITPDAGIKDEMGIDRPVAVSRDLNTNFVDDDELQAALARSRKAKMKQVPKLSPEEIARRVAEEKAEREAEIKIEEVEEEGVLTIDDTSEFVRGITLEAKPGLRVVVIPTARATSTARESPEAEAEAEAEVDAMDEDQPGELETGEISIKEEEEMQAALMALENVYGNDGQDIKKELEDEFEVGTALEKVHTSVGLASTLSILKQQGVFEIRSEEQRDREKTQHRRDLWLAEQRTKLAKRELERVKSRGANKDQQQREYENRLREQQEAREGLDLFKDYKPDVNIVYHDEFGRVLTPKEAWKALSHRFHGKGSGKMKTEKRLKRIADEQNMAAMAAGDTPLSMTRAFQMRQEKVGQAHMVLSVGNRGAAPAVSQYLDDQPLAKTKAEKKAGKKGKDAEKHTDSAALIDMTDFVTAPGQPSSNASPAPRAGFTKVGSFVPATAVPVNSGGESPAGGGFRTAISLKRKAEDEGTNTPPTKRRL